MTEKKLRVLNKVFRFHNRYESWMCDKIIEVAAKGGFLSHMCLELGVSSKNTLYNWMNDHPEFKESYEIAKLFQQGFYEDIAKKIAIGELKGDYRALALIMNNKYSDEYKRIHDKPITEINIGVINNVKQLGTDDLIRRAEELTEDLRLIEHNPIEVEAEYEQKD